MNQQRDFLRISRFFIHSIRRWHPTRRWNCCSTGYQFSSIYLFHHRQNYWNASFWVVLFNTYPRKCYKINYCDFEASKSIVDIINLPRLIFIRTAKSRRETVFPICTCQGTSLTTLFGDREGLFYNMEMLIFLSIIHPNWQVKIKFSDLFSEMKQISEYQYY